MDNFGYLTLLLPSIVASIWLVIISLSGFKEKKVKLVLSFFMLSVIFSTFPGFLFFTGYYSFWIDFYVISVFFGLSQFPSFYIYFVLLTSESSIPLVFYFKHLIIPVLSTIVAIYSNFWLLSSSEMSYFAESVLTGSVVIVGKYKFAFIVDKSFKVIFVLSALVYFHLINKRVNKHEAQILDYFSNTDKLSFKWFKVLKITFFFASLSGIVYHSFNKSFHLQNIWILVITFSLLSIFYWVVGFFGNKQVDIYEDKYEGSVHNNKLLQVSDKNIILETNKINEIAHYIDAVIINKKLYLKHNLTLADLAIVTRTDRNKLSYVIKNHLKINFNNYINQKRVNHAKQVLSKNSIIYKDRLFKDCGFKTQKKFYEIFKKFTGETPTEYRNKKLLSFKKIN